MRGNNSGLLAVDYTGFLVVIFDEYYFHVAMRKDGLGIGHRGTRDLGEWMSFVEVINDDGVHLLGAPPGHRYNTGLTISFKGMPYVFIADGARRTYDNPLLHCADLRFDRTSYPNEIQNFPVVQIDDSKLLVQMMLHGVLRMECIVIGY